MTSIPSSEPARNADGEREILTIERGAEERLRVALTTYKGRTGVDLRVLFHASDGTWRPTKSGVRIRPEHLDDVIGAMNAARDHLARGGSW